VTPTLELTFHDVAGDPWEGRATPRFQGEPGEPFPVREGMTGKERGEVRWYIEEFMDLPEGANLRRAREVEAALEAFGRRLWDGLSGPAAERWLGAVQAARGGRLELRAATARDELAFRTPWELLRVDEKGGGGRLLHQLGVTIIRRVDTHLPRLPLPDTSNGLRILTIVCRPEEAGFLDPRYTLEAILEALADRDEVEVDFCRPGTLPALVEALEAARRDGRPYHVLHFDGHGTTLEAEGGIGALCFEDAAGGLHFVRAPELGDLLSSYDVPLAVLEACRTATEAFAQDTVAGALLRHGVGTVVAMGHAVHVDLTRELMAGFYGAIGDGAALSEALQAARNRGYTQPARRIRIVPDAPTVELRDWFVPQLYQGAEDPRLLPKKPRRRKRRPEPVFHGFPPAPRAGFQGRGYELHRLERALSAHRAVVVHAPGGMGKTALAREAAQWWVRTGFFPDGAVFVSLEGNPSPERLIALVGEALAGIEFHREKDSAAWLEGELGRRRLLLIWDSYESVLPAFNAGRPTPPEFAELARKWTAGGSRLLVTCRSAEVGFEAQPFRLGELSRVEGLMLLVDYLDRQGVDRREREKRGWTGEALEPLVLGTGGHPLALELLAPQVAKLGPERVLADLSERLGAAEQESPEGRNRSLRASLDFSVRHLSAEARAALPAVALLAGGCPETMAQLVVGFEPEAWAAVRAELEAIGLVRVDGPFFRPHPVLAEVEALGAGPPTEEAEERLFEVVRSFAAEFDQLVRTSDARVALAVMAATEVVARRAVERAAAGGRLELAWFVADSLRLFLERTGRASEGSRLMTELRDRADSAAGEITEVSATLIREAARARVATDSAAAIHELVGLLTRLRLVQGWDARLELALCLVTLGRVHNGFARRPGDGIPPLEEAVRLFGELETEGRTDTANRAAALGDLANALSPLGRFAEALATAEEGLRLNRARADPLAASRAEGRIAHILAVQGRFADAEERYRRALQDAESAGDYELTGILWQSLGVLALDRNRPGEASEPLRRALEAFQHTGDDQGRMQVLNSLGGVEATLGHRTAALDWYQQSLALAVRVEDLAGQAMARGNRARHLAQLALETADPVERLRLLNEAIAEERESLALHEQLAQPAAIAIRHRNLAGNLRLIGQLVEAERHALQALEIHERLDLPDIWRPLAILGEIAEAREDVRAAAEWRRRAEEARAVASRRPGPDSLPQEFVVSLLQLALSARAQEAPLSDTLRSAGADDPVAFLASLEQGHSWLAAHLHALAAGADRPAAPAPPPYPPLLDQVWQATAAS
jgi:tetratricopeptide (TPR) repeat protein